MTDSTPEDAQARTPGPRTWDSVHSLFHEGMELDPAARAALLERVAAEDPELAAQVRSLLASHEAAGDFLDRPAAAGFLEEVRDGERLGPYRIVEEIGRGGMGVVYRAMRDDKHFHKEVAIKLIDPAMRGDAVLRRFRAERQILAMLDHPHIARLLDGGATPSGSPYLVMEYVVGQPLPAYCDAHKLDIAARIRLFLTVCDAVQFAHERLVVHRDLKADNILVTDAGSPLLLDFGIAKLLGADDGAPIGTATVPMQRLLTPEYASPEQVRGDPVTVASDVYSLGVILYELLTGSRPLRFTTGTPEEVLRVVTQDEPARPSATVAPRLRRRLAGDLDYIALKALEKDPARRYGSVEQFARDLRRHLENRPVLARGRTTMYLVSRTLRRHRVAFLAGGLVGLSLLAGLVGTTWQAQVAARERDRARRRFDDVRSLAHAVVFDLHDAIVSLPGSTRARELLVGYALRYLDGLGREAAGDPALQNELGVAYGKIGDVEGRPEFPNLGRTDDALKSYRRSMDLLGAAAKARPDSLAYTRNLALTMQRLGDLVGRMGRKDEAMRLEQDAKRKIVEARVLYPADPLLRGDVGVACDRISDLKFAAGDTVGALRESLEGNAVVEPLYLENCNEPQRRRSMMVGYAKVASLWAATGNRVRAAEDYRKSEVLARACARALPDNTDAARDLGVVFGMRAQFLADGGQFDSALVLYTQSMAITEDLAAADPSDVLQQADVASGHFEIGKILLKARRYPEAEDHSGEAFRRFTRLAQKDSSNTETRAQLARASRQAGEACAAMAARSHSTQEGARWRAKSIEWYTRSLETYRGLLHAGALAGSEAKAPQEIAERMAAMR